MTGDYTDCTDKAAASVYESDLRRHVQPHMFGHIYWHEADRDTEVTWWLSREPLLWF